MDKLICRSQREQECYPHISTSLQPLYHPGLQGGLENHTEPDCCQRGISEGNYNCFPGPTFHLGHSPAILYFPCQGIQDLERTSENSNWKNEESGIPELERNSLNISIIPRLDRHVSPGHSVSSLLHPSGKL